MLKIKRIYELYEEKDGFRILVDRLWPRGLTKSKVKINLWLKEISPSDELRKSFGHEIKKWTHFKKEYKKELKKNHSGCIFLLKYFIKEKKTVTLVYAAKDEKHNNAVVLYEILKNA